MLPADAQMNHHDALRAALIDWRVPALALDALPWVCFALPWVCFALALWALLWWGVALPCFGCAGLLWGLLWLAVGLWLWVWGVALASAPLGRLSFLRFALQTTMMIKITMKSLMALPRPR